MLEISQQRIIRDPIQYGRRVTCICSDQMTSVSNSLSAILISVNCAVSILTLIVKQPVPLLPLLSFKLGYCNSATIFLSLK